jgi:hypothetical protein
LHWPVLRRVSFFLHLLLSCFASLRFALLCFACLLALLAYLFFAFAAYLL